MKHPRVGHGHDIHRLQPAGRLMVGGVCVSESMSAVAHSDGDVLLHALVDAILGALGLGDIGERFPNTDERWRGADSSLFVRDAVEAMRERGMELVNLDATVLAERPKLKSFKPAIVARLRELTGCDAVNVKAGTNEGCDAIGHGEAIAATVVVLLAASA